MTKYEKIPAAGSHKAARKKNKQHQNHYFNSFSFSTDKVHF